MAFGPSTDIFQQAIQLLMQGRNPTPLAPAPLPPISTPPTFAPPPEPAPVAPAPALDQSLIERLTGARPVAPATQPDSLILKIARALQGFGAGVQGQGPQFLETLRRQREEPIERYKAESRIYEDRRRRATEIAENKRQGEQADIQRRADIQSNREFQLFEQGQRDRAQEARDLRLQAAQLEREDRRIQAEQLEQQRKERTQQERDARQFAAKFGSAGGGNAPPKIAKELGEYYAGMTENLSPAAAKWESTQAQLNEIRLRRAQAGGTRGDESGTNEKAQRAAAEIQSIKDKMIEAEARGDQQTVKQLHTRVKAVIRNAARFPEIEAGFDSSGKWPYVKMRGAQGPSAPATVTPGAQPLAQAADIMATPPPETVQAYMQRFGIADRNQAIRELMGQ